MANPANTLRDIAMEVRFSANLADIDEAKKLHRRYEFLDAASNVIEKAANLIATIERDGAREIEVFRAGELLKESYWEAVVACN